ncbi:hypothetical protein Pst134EB_025370 [Puccinia striiformis f. sp. tritici]|nr:hypothetical protein Pst134EB_025370 [Puccinia striiformis f. sp. tritici]
MISPKTPDGNINMILKRSVNFQDGFTASPEAIVTSAQAISGQHRVKAVNLPDWSTIGKPLKLSDSWNPSYNPRDSTALTSHPATHIKSGLEKRVLRLLNPIVFEHFLLNTQSRNKFRSWLEQHESPDSSAILKLDQWTDQTRLTAMVDLVRKQSEIIYELYHMDKYHLDVDPRRVCLKQQGLKDLIKLVSLQEPLKYNQQELLHSLYDQEFRKYITSKLTEQSTFKLSRQLSTTGSPTGLGDAFCLCNPRMRDTPIILVSPGFEAVTGYSREEILGRNCRFLQGPGTSRASVERIKRALGSAEPVVELLLNYRRDGTPFHCLLSIVPLFDVQGQLTYFLAGQVNVTGELESSQDMLDLLSRQIGEHNDAEHPSNLLDHSPRMTQFRSPPVSRFGSSNSKAEPDRISEPCTQILNAKSEVGVGKGSLHLTKKRLAALVSRLALRRDGSECYTSTSDTTSAAGAVGQFDSNALPIEQQYEAFEHVYSRVLIFRREGYQVVYTTPKALRYLGLPTITRNHLCCSRVLNTSFLDLVTVRETPTKKDKHSKTTKAMIKEAIKRGLPISFEGDVILSDSGTQRQRNTRVDVPSGRTTMIHLSPLIDCHGDKATYVVVISS